MDTQPFRYCCVIALIVISSSGRCLGQEQIPAPPSQVSDQEQDAEKQLNVQISGPAAYFPPLSQVFIDRFFDALRSKSSFVAQSLVESQKVDANTSGMWAGTKTSVETEIDHIELRFRPTAEARLARTSAVEQGKAGLLAEEFTFQVSTQRLGFQLRFPLALDKYFQRGLLAEIANSKKTPARTEFLRAVRDAGMYISMPAMMQSEVYGSWGILLCPRVIAPILDQRGYKIGIQLQRSPYELSEVKTVWSARASAGIPLGTRRERLKIEHSLSSDMPKGLEYFDEVATVSPRIALEYQPTTASDFVRFPQNGEFRQGMIFTVEMQNAPGYRRVQHYSHVLYVHRVDEPSPVSVVIRDTLATKDEGTCYVIASQRSVWSKYDKQAPVQ